MRGRSPPSEPRSRTSPAGAEVSGHLGSRGLPSRKPPGKGLEHLGPRRGPRAPPGAFLAHGVPAEGWRSRDAKGKSPEGHPFGLPRAQGMNLGRPAGLVRRPSPLWGQGTLPPSVPSCRPYGVPTRKGKAPSAPLRSAPGAASYGLPPPLPLRSGLLRFLGCALTRPG